MIRRIEIISDHSTSKYYVRFVRGLKQREDLLGGYDTYAEAIAAIIRVIQLEA